MLVILLETWPVRRQGPSGLSVQHALGLRKKFQEWYVVLNLGKEKSHLQEGRGQTGLAVCHRTEPLRSDHLAQSGPAPGSAGPPARRPSAPEFVFCSEHKF